MVLASEMDVAARFDSYFKNLGRSKNEMLSSLETWRMGDISEGDTKTVKVWETEFKAQAICLNWTESCRIATVGLDNGWIYCFKFIVSNPKNPIPLLSTKVHSSRVMKIHYCDDSNHIFSVGADGYLRRVDL